MNPHESQPLDSQTAVDDLPVDHAHDDAPAPAKARKMFAPIAWMNAVLERIPHPTKSGVLYLCVAGLIYLQSARETELAVRNLLVLLASGLLALFVASFVFGPLNLRRLEVRRKLRGPAQVGVPYTLTLALRNPRRLLPACLVRMRETQTSFMVAPEPAVTAVYAPAGGEARVRLKVLFSRRGFYDLERASVSTAFPFGLVRFGRTARIRTRVTVYPRAIPIPEWMRVRLLRSAHAFGERLAARHGEDEVFGVREYRMGDNVRRIHWRTTARHGHPMMLEMEGRQDMHYRLILDTHVYEPSARARAETEQLISLAAGLVECLVRQGMAVGMAHWGAQDLHFLPESRGEPVYHSLMETLAGAGQSQKPLDQWIHRGLEGMPRGGMAIALTARGSEYARSAMSGFYGRGGMVLSLRDMEVIALFANPTLPMPTIAEQLELLLGEPF